MLKSPLRYPGGKQKAISQIAHYLPPKFKEFREPFVGGGSIFFYVLQNLNYFQSQRQKELLERNKLKLSTAPSLHL